MTEEQTWGLMLGTAIAFGALLFTLSWVLERCLP